MSSRAPVSVPLFAYGLVCVRVFFPFYLPLCPTLYCNVVSFPPHCSASPPDQGVWSVSLEEVSVARCREIKANTEMHKHRKCRLPRAGSRWASVTLRGLSDSGNNSSLSNRTSFSDSRPPSHLDGVSRLLSVITTRCSSTACLNTGYQPSCRILYVNSTVS